MDSITDNGTATSIGKKRRNKGTAIKDSPKPKVDLTSEAKKLIARINIVVKVLFFGQAQLHFNPLIRRLLNNNTNACFV